MLFLIAFLAIQDSGQPHLYDQGCLDLAGITLLKLYESDGLLESLRFRSSYTNEQVASTLAV